MNAEREGQGSEVELRGWALWMEISRIVPGIEEVWITFRSQQRRRANN